MWPKIRARYHMIPTFQMWLYTGGVKMLVKFTISAHVSLDKMTINDPIAQRKTRNLKGTVFHFNDYGWKSTSNSKKKKGFQAGKFPSTK